MCILSCFVKEIIVGFIRYNTNTVIENGMMFLSLFIYSYNPMQLVSITAKKKSLDINDSIIVSIKFQHFDVNISHN